jgi:hypothetical protein
MTMGTRPYSRYGWDGGCWYGDEEKNARGGAASESRRGAAGKGGRATELGPDLGLGEEAGSGVAPAVWWPRVRAEEGVMAAAASSRRGGGSEATDGAVACGRGLGMSTDGEGRLL